MNMNTKEKVRLITRVFLAVNKGKRFTGKQICEFINSNKLGVRGGVNTQMLGALLDKNYCYAYHISRKRASGRNVWYYSVVD